MQAPGLYDPLLAMRRCIIPPATRLSAWVWSPDRPSLLYLDWSFPSQLRRGSTDSFGSALRHYLKSNGRPAFVTVHGMYLGYSTE